MISVILAVALATPCMAPPKPVHHRKHHAAVAAQSCVTPPVSMCFREPAPDPEPIPLPQVVPYYITASAAPTTAPAATYSSEGASFDGYTFVPGGGGGVVSSITVSKPSKPVIVTTTTVVTIIEPPPAPPITPMPPWHTRPRDPPHNVRCPEMDASTGLSACLLLGGILAVIRGRRC